jgi:hypothetical protein
MKDFFISYTSADKSWAEWIAWELEQASYTTVIQACDFRPGSNFVSDMKTASDQCERTITVYSPNYFASTFAEAERTAAFAEKRMLAVRVRECQLLPTPFFFCHLDHVLSHLLSAKMRCSRRGGFRDNSVCRQGRRGTPKGRGMSAVPPGRHARYSRGPLGSNRFRVSNAGSSVTHAKSAFSGRHGRNRRGLR